MKKICVMSGSRAEYGLLYWTMKKIEESASLQLQLLVTGTHLREEFGSTFKEIESDGFKIIEKLDILTGGDTPVDIARATAKGIELFSAAFEKWKPDIVLLLGDRFETLAAASAALFLRIPVAHIGGGDTTEGAFDESIRHSITKMSHLHFVSNESSGRRVLQLGEDPAKIFNVGSPGLENILKTKLLTRSELEDDLKINFKEHILAVTFHPVTLEEGTSASQVDELLAALEQVLLDGKTTVVFSGSNADSGNHVINEKIIRFATGKENVKSFTTLGSRKYLSLLSHSSVVVGNSSSGILEAPAFKVPTVNIGDRQKGRLCAESVIHVPAERDMIVHGITQAMKLDCTNIVNPYGSGETSAEICTVLETTQDFKHLLKKHFYEI